VDFDLDDRQRALLDVVDAVVAESGSRPAFDVSAENGYDADTDVALYAALRDASLSLLDRVLIAERLAWLGTATAAGFWLAVEAAGAGPVDEPAVSVVGPSGLMRFGAQARVAVVERSNGICAVRLASGAVEPVRSGFGFPYARVRPEVADAAPVVAVLDAERWREAIALIRAAEIAGAAQAAVSSTATHLSERSQFGRPLATLQALRHRLAEAAVSAEACQWLVREAAATRTARGVAVAAQYARWTAATLVPELVQLGGARSFAREFGRHVYTMRLEALRLELGGPDRLAGAVNAAPLAAEVGNGR
jgi:Acyl-CoA dehydrogenase, C-terminal domain